MGASKKEVVLITENTMEIKSLKEKVKELEENEIKKKERTKDITALAIAIIAILISLLPYLPKPV